MMNFLKLVADDLYNRYNGNFEGTAIVFPNKRASLFFNNYLLQKTGKKAIWSPAYITISELFEQSSDYVTADPVLLVSKLHKEYVKHTGSNDTLDAFYYWGEMLIRDFDDIDKNLADAEKLFSNIKDLHELGTAKDVLEPEQQEAVMRFFANFKPEEESVIKERFTKVWEVLYPIYMSFKQQLKAEGVAYQGMLYRDVIENCDKLTFRHDKYVFIGFNALNGVENKLFDIIKREKEALFYWDYDKHYIDNKQHEAGHFMRKNLDRFPNALQGDFFNNLTGEKDVTFVSASSDNIQARYVSTWLQNNLTENEIDTAIVLCDETMLEPTLHSLPDKANGKELKLLNVTMGFPLSHTPIYTLVKQLVELQVRGYDRKQAKYTLAAVERVLKHPYIVACSPRAYELRERLLREKRFFPTTEELCVDEILSLLFNRTEDNAEWIKNISALIYAIANERATMGEISNDLYEELFCEALLKAHSQTLRLLSLIEKGEIEMQQASIGNLLVRLISQLSMPFHGEPVVGLQIMGLLETRNLDFEHLIILAANEGNLPKSSSDNSYIPYNLRRAFGLTLSEHRDSIYAYYFYRLLQRARKVTILYNSSTESKTKGECSRYLLQILGSNLYNVKRVRLEAAQNNNGALPQEVRKSPLIMQMLHNRFNVSANKSAALLSPTGINRYLTCGLKFFYYYIMKLSEKEEVDTELKPIDFGNIFHKAAELLYEEILKTNNGTIDKSDFEKYIKTPQLLYRFINDAFVEKFFKKGNKAVYNGEQFINRGVLHDFLHRLVKMDNTYTPFKYAGSEKTAYLPFAFKGKQGEEILLNIGGIIDRVDIKNGTLNIVDYKTGGGKKDTKTSLDDIFAHNGTSSGYRFQAFLYSVAIIELLKSGNDFGNDERLSWIEDLKKTDIEKVIPSLIYIHKKANAQREDFIIDMDKKPIDNVADFKDEFLARLQDVLLDIFDIDKPFAPTEDKERCTYCEYRNICGRV